MQISLAAGAPAALLSKNYLNRHAQRGGDITASTGQDFVHRLYDGDPKSYWTSAGSNDTIAETIEFGLWQSDGRTMREVDFIGFLNHNVKKIKVETSATNGAPYTTRIDVDNLTEPDYRVSFGALFDADRVRVTLYTTQVADEDKTVGELIIAAGLFQFTYSPLKRYRRADRVAHKTSEMGDRSKARAYIGRSDASHTFFEGNFSFLEETDARKDAAAELLKGKNQMILLPEPFRRPGEAYLGQVIPGTYKDDYAVEGSVTGHVISFDWEEMGGN